MGSEMCIRDSSYLKSSTLGFVPPAEVERQLREAGFQDVGSESRYLGTNVIFWGRKPTAI